MEHHHPCACKNSSLGSLRHEVLQKPREGASQQLSGVPGATGLRRKTSAGEG